MKKVNINNVVFYLILVFPITTILQNISIFSFANKFIVAILFGALMYCDLYKKMYKRSLINFILMIMVYVFALVNTKTNMEINIYFYFAIWMLYYIYLTKSVDLLMKITDDKMKSVKLVIIIFNLITVFSMFVKKSYINGYFSPFGCGEHRFGSCCMLLFALNILLVKKTNNKKFYIFSIIPAIGIAMGGARTYLVVYLVYIMCIYYKSCKQKYKFYLCLIPMAIIVYMLVQISPIATKIKDTSTEGYYGFLATLTSGRSMFWECDLKEFFKLDLFRQFTGNGFDFVYDVNEKYINRRIWAHNDFINILMNFGYTGLFIYLNVFFYFCKKHLNIKNKIPRIGFYFIWFFNAFFNMVYTYPLAMLSIPFIAESLSENEKGGKIDERK